jgi:sodium/potassium-transporting ATPase subunit alpha
MGTDIVPSVGFCFEKAELDIMTRRPRHSEEHLVGGRLMVYSYLQ